MHQDPTESGESEEDDDGEGREDGEKGEWLLSLVGLHPPASLQAANISPSPQTLRTSREHPQGQRLASGGGGARGEEDRQGTVMEQ